MIRVKGLTDASRRLLKRYLGLSVRFEGREGKDEYSVTDYGITFGGTPVPFDRNPLHEPPSAVTARTIANHYLRRTASRPEPLDRVDPDLALKLEAQFVREVVCDGKPLRAEHVPPGTVVCFRRKKHLVVASTTEEGGGVRVRTVPPLSSSVLTGEERGLRFLYPVPGVNTRFLKSKLRLVHENPRLRAYFGGTLLHPSEETKKSSLRELFTREILELQRDLRKAGGIPPVSVSVHEPIQFRDDQGDGTVSIDETQDTGADVQLFPVHSQRDGRWRLISVVGNERKVTIINPHMTKGAPLRVSTKESGYQMETDPTKKRRREDANTYVADAAMRLLLRSG